MRLLGTLEPRPRRAAPYALALGVFDGVHRGHAAVLRRAVALARARGWTPAALTFDPPPEAALGLAVPPRLAHPDEQAERIRELGIRELRRVPFTRTLAALPAERFAREVLARDLRCAAVVVGDGFRFGAGARGDAALLRRLGDDLDWTAVAVPPVLDKGRPVSSTRVRAAVLAGRLADAARLLGRPWRLRGRVVRGRRLGRTLGFPTANLDSPQTALPPRGVWAGRVRVLGADGPGRWWGFAGNLGVRPTVEDAGAVSVELHLLGFAGRLEGRTLEAEFFARLRPERRFGSLEALRRAIARDTERARRLLAARRA